MTRWQTVFLMAACCWGAGIAWGSLAPAADLPQHLPWDKFNHFAAYAGLAGWLRFSGRRWPLAWATAVAVSIAIEYLQLLVPGRDGGDWEDILANALGAGCGVALASWLVSRRWVARWFDR
ncbi:VanZ family protein [Salinicola rhizosphaerae]|uniref:VanZ-like domain-containing protein n=1 Tax=Salinicola rhizosphaerae TaxID=1443141 RepID=A0ABQ3DR08_9GAMM|nr:VanZ family protein [Salinicola rhizosphaerae]GHB12631.1 hypothetical protein GCM10009038_08200 [Salinicola rhizosphaerae]